MALEALYIPQWADLHMPALIYITGVVYLQRPTSVVSHWIKRGSLHLDVFCQICVGTLDVDILASLLHRKVPRFVASARTPMADAMDVLEAVLSFLRVSYSSCFFTCCTEWRPKGFWSSGGLRLGLFVRGTPTWCGWSWTLLNGFSSERTSCLMDRSSTLPSHRWLAAWLFRAIFCVIGGCQMQSSLH